MSLDGRMVLPVAFAQRSISISSPSYITKCRTSVKILTSSAWQNTSISMKDSFGMIPFLIIGLNIELAFFVKQ